MWAMRRGDKTRSRHSVERTIFWCAKILSEFFNASGPISIRGAHPTSSSAEHIKTTVHDVDLLDLSLLLLHRGSSSRSGSGSGGSSSVVGGGPATTPHTRPLSHQYLDPRLQTTDFKGFLREYFRVDRAWRLLGDSLEHVACGGTSPAKREPQTKAELATTELAISASAATNIRALAPDAPETLSVGTVVQCLKHIERETISPEVDD